MGEIGPDCIRCGLCCIAAPCDDNDVCANLLINEDLTTTCTDPNTVRHMVGPGCTIRGIDERTNLDPMFSIYEDQKDMYDLINTKKTLLKQQK